MALIEVRVPQLSESVAEATLLQWHKQAGDAVARDEHLIDGETHQDVLELPAPAAGEPAPLPTGGGSTVVTGEELAINGNEARAGTRAAAAAAPAAPPHAA